MIWANLIHLSYNMWCDREAHERNYPLTNVSRLVKRYHIDYLPYKPHLRCDGGVWDAVAKEMAAAGMNMLVIDVGDGVRYESHPEIAVKGAWSVDRLRRELAKLRAMGIEPIPKLNFSACHDAWLGPYSRAVSTPAYYRVVRDLIAEVVRIFRPRFFHIGMDEETASHQRFFSYVVLRQFDLWWHDLLFYVDEIEKRDVRAWVWSDYIWHHPDVFLKKMPRSVLQSNWYYDETFTKSEFAAFAKKVKNPEAVKLRESYVRAYEKLDAAGYDQVPTGSSWASSVNFAKTVGYCTKTISPKRLKGFLMTAWAPTMPPFRDYHLDAVRQVRQAKAFLDSQRG